MERYEPATHSDRIASIYDLLYPPGPDAEEAAELLVSLAGSGRALELGIGAGRVALPLAARGVEVHGIDVSEAMVAQLLAKPGGERVPVVIGDFTAGHRAVSFTHPVSVTPRMSPESGDDLSPSRR